MNGAVIHIVVSIHSSIHVLAGVVGGGGGGKEAGLKMLHPQNARTMFLYMYLLLPKDPGYLLIWLQRRKNQLEVIHTICNSMYMYLHVRDHTCCSSTATNTVLYQMLDGQATSITAMQQVNIKHWDIDMKHTL